MAGRPAEAGLQNSYPADSNRESGDEPGERRVIPRSQRVSGSDIGVIMLDTDLPRPVGDLGNAWTFGFPVHYDFTPGAPVPAVVERHAEGLLEKFITTGTRLLDRGARALATSCGFLAIYQRELAAALPAPVATSSLLQIPMILRLLMPEQHVALLTIRGAAIGEPHFRGAGVTGDDIARVRVIGLENTAHLYPVIVGTKSPLDVGQARAEAVTACQTAQQRDPSIGAFVLECTNLPPYAQAIREGEATACPVWDAVTLVTWLQQGMNS